jgi:lipoate-protein ligase B
LVPESSLSARGIEFFHVERGGDITYHGPGQLVGYPILDLTEYGSDVHSYLRQLEQVLIETLTAFGLGASRWIGRTGVWVRGGKIASIGIHVSRWVTRHGFALNVDMNLAPFDLIVPCGIKSASATSIGEELSRPVTVEEVIPVLARRFEASFGVDLLPTSPDVIFGSIGPTHQGVHPTYPPLEAHDPLFSTASSLP